MKANFHYFIFFIIVLMLFNSYAFAQPIGTAIIHDKISTTDSVIINQRMRLNGITSTCDSVKAACPGVFGSSGVYYNQYCYTNESATSVCIMVMMEVHCNAQLFCAAYLGNFDANNVCSNYLADAGLSIANGGSDSMSFEVPAGGQYCIVVSGVIVADTCENYTLRIAQFATSWHGSINPNDSTQSNRLHLDGVRYSCTSPKQLCAKPPKPGLVYHDGYLYNNTTPNAVCIRAKLFNYCSDTAGRITVVAYLNSYDSTNVCYNIAADAGITTLTNDSSWFTFLAPAGTNYLIVVYSQKDSVFCTDYALKLEADFTLDLEDIKTNTTGLQVFPNPVLQGTNLIVELGNENFERIELYDIASRKIFAKQFSANQKSLIFSTAFLTKGIYLLKVSAAEKSFIRKVIVD